MASEERWRQSPIGWVPVGTARKLLGVSRQRVYALISEGKLTARDMDGTVLVSHQSVRSRIALMQGSLVMDGEEV